MKKCHAECTHVKSSVEFKDDLDAHTKYSKCLQEFAVDVIKQLQLTNYEAKCSPACAGEANCIISRTSSMYLK